MVNPLSSLMRTPYTGQTGAITGGGGQQDGIAALLALLQMLLANQQAGGNTAAPAAPAGEYKKTKGSAEDKRLIGELSQELGIENKGGSKKVWAERAKTDGRIKILDENGTDKTQSGKIEKGDILEVQSQKYGVVRIQVGGDGEINGGDDKVLSVGGKAAVGNMATGLNQINQGTYPANQASPGIQAPQNAQADYTGGNYAGGGNVFTDQQLRSLLAALMNLILNQQQPQARV